MKYFSVFIITLFIAFPVFSQSANSQKYKALSDGMGKTIENSNSQLQYYDELAGDNSNSKTYTEYMRKHDFLSRALRDVEARLDFYIRANELPSVIKRERDNYERLIRQLEDLKKEYDNWLNSIS